MSDRTRSPYGTTLYGAWVSERSDDESGAITADEAPLCSAKGCRAAATVDLVWRNPRLHDTARRKHWVACAQHEQHLAEFLSRRGFLLGRGPLM